MSSSEVKTFRLPHWVIGILLLGMVVFLLLPGSGRSHNAASRRTACKNNLHQIEMALHYYHDKYHCFPPAYVADASGRPLHSWRVLLLPFLEQENLYRQYRFDEPWDGTRNHKLADQIGNIFHCPSDKSAASTDTSYVVVVGPNTMFPGTECRRFADMTDGVVNTILVVEIANSGIHWMEPRDLAFEDAIKGVNPKDGPGISSEHVGVAQVVRGDATVKVLSDIIPQDTLRWALERNDGHVIPDY